MTTNQHPQLTGPEILRATLAGEGTTAAFSYPSDVILPIGDARRKLPTIRDVLVRQKQSAHIA